MPEDQVEMLWLCGDKGCNYENKGRFKKCQGCGRPKTGEDGYYMPGDISHEAAVTDEGQLRRAKGGADWFCHFCGTRQFSADKVCENCGVDQAQGNRVQESRLKIDPSWRMPASIPGLERPSWRKIGIIGGGGTLLLFLGIFGLIKLFTPRIVDATVVSSTWHTVVHVDLYSKHWHDGFDPPGNAVDVASDGQKIHHYDHVLVGHHEEPYNHHYVCGQTCRAVPQTCTTTPRSCRSNKNGYATCTGGDRVCSGGGQRCSDNYCDQTLYRTVNDYAEIPRFRDHFTWNAWEWEHERDLPLQGTDLTPVYAEPILRDDDNGQKERIGGKDETNDVVFNQGKDTWTYHPPTGELPQFTVGTKKRIKVGPLGGVELVR
jgi:hypothetical protein